MKKLEFKRVTAIVCFLGLGLGVANLASAQSPDADAPKLVIHYDRASLASDSGTRQLYRRLESAANKVCVGPQTGRFESDAMLACRKQAVADAVAHIHDARLAALSAGKPKIS